MGTRLFTGHAADRRPERRRGILCRGGILSAFPAIFLGVAGNLPAQPYSARDFAAFERGNDLLKDGKFDEAAASYRAAIASSPDFVAARNNLGVALYKRGYFDQALTEFNQVAAATGAHQAGGQLNVGAATARKDELDEALDKAEAAVTLRTDYAEAYFNVGWIQDQRGKLAEAETAYRNALQRQPQYAKAELGLAVALAKGRQFDDALEILVPLLRRDNLAPEDRLMAEKNLLAARVFAELANPSPKDQGETVARRSPTLTWGAKLRGQYSPLALHFSVCLAREGEDLSRQPEAPVEGRGYRPAPEMASGAYSWRITACTEDHQVASSPTYTFTHTRNLPPAVPSEPVLLTVKEHVPAMIPFTGTDPENDPLTFRIVQSPSNGTITGTVPNLLYKSADGFVGEDEFTYVANDGYGDSSPATVRCVVAPDLRAENQRVVVRKNVARGFLLASTGRRGRSLDFSITTRPAHGDLSGDPPALTYTPAKDFVGEDSIGFVVAWQSYKSTPGRVTLAVRPTARPVAAAQKLEMPQYGRLAVELAASDADQVPLQYRIVRSPQFGELTGQANPFVYRPSSGYVGSDSFQFTANNGFEDSEPTTVEIGVLPWFIAHRFFLVVVVVLACIGYLVLCGRLLNRGRDLECLVALGLLALLLVGTPLLAAHTWSTAGLLATHCAALFALTTRACSATLSRMGRKGTAGLANAGAERKQSKMEGCSCPECGARLTFPGDMENSAVRCPKCGGVFTPRSVLARAPLGQKPPEDSAHGGMLGPRGKTR